MLIFLYAKDSKGLLMKLKE